ncbi:transposase [Streptomyces coelicoflavus]|uniref:Transposase n=1 Tax=Streptomyces coelicoflavus TaxID=285562 RepID=A0A6N9V269_9ACTN|nr:transposase [Streptomyces coelicoflavus]
MASPDIVDAIRYLVDNGVKRRALPAVYPPWQTVYYHFAAWRRRGAIGFLRDQLRRQIRTGQGRCP